MSQISADHLGRAAYVYVRQSTMGKFSTTMKASDGSMVFASGRGCLGGRM